MKEIFFEFYKPDDKEIKIVWDSAIFTFDANVLLNLYRYSSKTTNELLDILKQLKDKLWLTNQAGFEYQNNRLTVIHKQKIAYDEIKLILAKKLEEVSSDLNSYKKHSTIEVDTIKENISKSFDKINSDIDRLSKSHPSYEPIDQIRDELTNLFAAKTGKPYAKEKLVELFKEAQQRYDNEIPPGFKDKSSKKDAPKQSLYGDVILWKQIMEKAKGDSKSVILVTDDLKDDWWDKFKGETQGPRKELLREFYEETGQSIYIYQADKFFEYANKLKIGKTVKTEAIKEIRDIRLKDEEQLKERALISDSMKKIIESQREYFQSDEYKKMIDRISAQQSLFKIDPETLKKIEDSLGQYQSMQLKFNYPDLLNSYNTNFGFGEHERRKLFRIAELFSAQRAEEEEEDGGSKVKRTMGEDNKEKE